MWNGLIRYLFGLANMAARTELVVQWKETVTEAGTAQCSHTVATLLPA